MTHLCCFIWTFSRSWFPLAWHGPTFVVCLHSLSRTSSKLSLRKRPHPRWPCWPLVRNSHYMLSCSCFRWSQTSHQFHCGNVQIWCFGASMPHTHLFVTCVTFACSQFRSANWAWCNLYEPILRLNLVALSSLDFWQASILEAVGWNLVNLRRTGHTPASFLSPFKQLPVTASTNAHDSSPVWYRTKYSKIMNSQPRQIELANRQIMVMLSVDVHFAFLDVLCSMNGSILKKQWRLEQRPLEPQHWSNEGTPQQIEIRDNKHINWTPLTSLNIHEQ